MGSAIKGIGDFWARLALGFMETVTVTNVWMFLNPLFLKKRCVVKPDPCNPSPCGPGTKCMEDAGGNAICRCLRGLIPEPDTITGCGPECTVGALKHSF